MKKSFTGWRALLVGVAIFASSSGLLMAQTTGEYRSNAPTPTGGNWSNAATWQTLNGTSWVTASVAPTGAEPKITIQSTDSVYVDAAVTIADTVYNQGKLVAGGTNLTIGSGGVYQHAENGGSIPTATWNTGSTCLITGVTSSAPSNANQNFYNFTWNCTGQTTGLNVAWNGNTIAGNLTVSAPSGQQFRMSNNNANSGSPITIKILGNVIVNGGQLTPTGSGTAQSYTIIDSGNIYVSAGKLYASGGSGGSVTWKCYGDTFSVASGTTLQTSNTSSRWLFAKQGTQSFVTSGTVTYTGGMTFEVDTNATLDLGTSVIAGSSAKFKLDSASTVMTAQPTGLNGNLTNAGPDTLSPYANYVFNGSAAQVTGSLLPATVGGLTVNNSAGVTLSKSVSVLNTLTLTNGNLLLDTNYVMASVVSGASATSYAVTDSSKSSFMVPNVGATKVMFPVGTTAEGYSPVWMTNAGTVDTFAVAAQMDTSAAVGGGRVNVKWNVSENNPGGANCALTFGWTSAAENAAFTADRAAYAQIYNLSGAPYIQAGTGTYTSQFTTEPFTLSRGAILTLGSFAVGKFGLAVNPLVGDFGSVASGYWSSLSTWKQWNGTAWITAAVAVPSGAVNVFINKGDTVTVDAIDSVGGNLIVGGYLKDVAGLKTAGATVVFDSASTYELAHNGGIGVGIPTATWNKGSLCLITGSSGTVSSTTGFNANQNFYNLTINAAFTSNKDLAWYNNTIYGNLVINNTGTSRVQLTSPGAGTFNTMTIKGNLLLTAGQFSTNGSSGSDTITVNSYGNITSAGANFSISRGSGPIVRWNSYGDSLTLSNTTTETSSSKAVLVFAKQGNQYLRLQGVTFGSGGLPVEVDTGATLVMGTSSVGGDGSFTADSGSVVMCGDTTGLNGNVATSGTVTLSPGASVEFNGAVAQTTGSLLSGTIRNLTINNSKGVTLTKSVTAGGTLTLTSGILFADTNSVTAYSVAGGSPTSYISTDSARCNLTVPSVGATQVIFPVGTDYGYAPVWVTLSSGSDDVSVSVKPDRTPTTNGLGRVNLKWHILKSYYGSPFTLQFGWMGSEEDSVFAQNRSSYAKIYLVTDTSALEQGSGSYTTQFSTQPYTVSRGGITALIPTSVAGVDTFGTDFVVGHFITTGVNEPLAVPIEFRLYQNYPNPFNPSTKIEFTVVKKGMASVMIYNILGQHVATLYSGEAQPGKKYFVDFNGSSLASGVYFSVLQSNGQRQIQKMVLMK